MLARDTHAQDAGPDAEAQRRVEHERLAVDAGGDGPIGVDLEGRRRPLAPRALQRRPPSPRPLGAPTTVIPSRPSSMRGRVPEPTARPSR